MKINEYKIQIYSCWALLGICFLLELFGVNFIHIGTDSQGFIKFCNFIDAHLFLKQILACITSVVLNSLVILAILKQKFYTKRQILIFIPVIAAGSLASWYSTLAQFLLNLMQFVIIVFIQPKKYKRCLLGIGLILVFELISAFIKDIGGIVITSETPTLISLILQIDTLIMCALYYLYATRETEVV